MTDANCFASDTMKEDTEVNEDQQDAENLFDAKIMLKPSDKNEDKEVDDLNLDRGIPTSKEAMQALNTIHYFLQTHEGSEKHILPIERFKDDHSLPLLKE
ncbi:hypothetical protein HZS_7359 [Henneguya salminicola]|nr:hypothetical protein HZS_7359 [Henneguya salminicola]